MYSFTCKRDNDIQNFFRDKAVEFERLSKARTYLVCDEGSLLNSGDIFILGYISLALKVLHIPDGFSVRQRKELDGYRGKVKNELVTDIPCYLIGQLARNDSATHEQISGRDMISYAQSIIMDSVRAIGGRFMMVECRNEQKLLKFYHDNGFMEVANVDDNSTPMVQMLCKVID